MPNTEVPLNFAAYVLDKTGGFTGRGWVFDAIDEWLSQGKDGPRYFLLTGDPGSGKSAIAGRLVQRSEGETAPDGGKRGRDGFISAAHFCIANDNHWINPRTFAESIARQLADRFPEFAAALIEKNSAKTTIIRGTAHANNNRSVVAGILIRQLTLGAESDGDAFNRLVRSPLETFLQERPKTEIVILIDALDESLRGGAGDSILSLIANASQMPPNVRFIVTSRPDERVLNEVKNSVQTFLLSASENDAANREDIAAYIQFRFGTTAPESVSATSPTLQDKAKTAFCDALTARANGNFLYVKFLMDEVAAGERSLTDFNGLPNGLDDLYLDSLNRTITREKRDWLIDYVPIFETLAAAQEEMTVRQLVAFTEHRETTLTRYLSELGPYLKTRTTAANDETVYRLYHASVGDFLAKRVLTIEKQERQNTFYLPAHDRHQRIVRRYASPGTTWQNLDFSRLDDYGYRYLSLHVLKATDDGLAQASHLLTPQFLQNKIAHFGNQMRVLNDLRLLLNSAAESGDSVETFAWAWGYVGFRERIAHRFLPKILPLYVRAGLVAEAMEGIESLDAVNLDFVREKTQARHELCLALTDEGFLDRALRLAGEIEESHRPATILEIARKIAVTDRSRARQIITDAKIAPGQREDFDYYFQPTVREALCGVLAEAPAFVEDALRLAGTNGAALEAIALAVLPRDFTTAWDICGRIRGVSGMRAGRKTAHNADGARVAVIAALAETDPDAAHSRAQLLPFPSHPQVILGIVRGLTKIDPRRAVHFVRDNHEALSDFRPLALAFIAAETIDPDVRQEIERLSRNAERDNNDRRWRTISVELLSYYDLMPLREDTLCCSLLNEVLERLENYCRSGQLTFDDPGEGVGLIAATRALLDVDAAISFCERPFTTGEGLDRLGQDTALQKVATRIARFDPEATERIISRIQGPASHYAGEIAVRSIAAYDFGAAVAMVKRIKHGYALSIATYVGAIASQLKPGETAKALSLLDLLPPYIESDAFTWEFNRTQEYLESKTVALPNPDIFSPRDNPANVYEAAFWLAQETASVSYWRQKAILRGKFPGDYVETVWKIAPEHPERAMDVLEENDDAEEGWRAVAASIAVVDPERALVLYRKHGALMSRNISGEDVEPIQLIACRLAENDEQQALNLIEEVEWKQDRDYAQGTGLAEVARGAARRDWRVAVAIAERIAYPERRSRALSYIAAEINSNPNEPDPTSAYSSLLVLISTIEEPNDRRQVYEILIKALALEKRPVQSVLPLLIAAVATQDRATFLGSQYRLQYKLVSLIRQMQPEVAPRLKERLETIRLLLDA